MFTSIEGISLSYPANIVPGMPTPNFVVNQKLILQGTAKPNVVSSSGGNSFGLLASGRRPDRPEQWNT